MDVTLCEQICNNTVGSYECKCEDGYQLVAGTNQCAGKMGVSYQIFYFIGFSVGSCVTDKESFLLPT